MLGSNASQKPERFAQLDGLRGFAALIVVISHSANAGLLPSIFGKGLGQMGVSLFYALSAFLLGHLYFKTSFGAASLRSYAVSRVARVLPLFYAVLAYVLVFYFLIEPMVQGPGRAYLSYAMLGADSFTSFAASALLIQGTPLLLWSIPVELQYYAVFAVLWWLAAYRHWPLWKVIAFGLVVQAGVAATLVGLVPGLKAANLAFWGHVFLAGLLLSQLPRRPFPDRWVGLQYVVVLAVALIAMPELRRSLGLPTLPNFADPLTVGVPILLLYLAIRQARPLRFLEAGPMRWLGRISFGLYLLHMPAIFLVYQTGLAQRAPVIGFCCVLGISLALAWGANRVIELPAQRWLKQHLNR